MLIRMKVKRKTIVFSKDGPVTVKSTAIIKQTEWKVEKYL